jgi:hypothetical protein
MKTPLPTYQAAAQAILEGTETPLDTFIYEEQPLSVNEKEFRANLIDLVGYFDKKRRNAEQTAALTTCVGGVVGILLVVVIKQLLNLN